MNHCELVDRSPGFSDSRGQGHQATTCVNGSSGGLTAPMMERHAHTYPDILFDVSQLACAPLGCALCSSTRCDSVGWAIQSNALRHPPATMTSNMGRGRESSRASSRGSLATDTLRFFAASASNSSVFVPTQPNRPCSGARYAKTRRVYPGPLVANCSIF